MTREVRCPMRECRKRIDLDALSSTPVPEREACMHFVAAWGGSRGGMVEETLAGLDGNRELLIRNIRPADYAGARLDGARAQLEAAIRYHGHVVDDAAVFGDLFERNGMSRAMAQLLVGADPIASRGDR